MVDFNKEIFVSRQSSPKKVLKFLVLFLFFHILGMIMSRVILFTGLKRRKFFKICPGMVLTTSLNIKPQRGTRRRKGTWYYNNYMPKSNRYALNLFIVKIKAICRGVTCEFIKLKRQQIIRIYLSKYYKKIFYPHWELGLTV